jgi:hypothetical protein
MMFEFFLSQVHSYLIILIELFTSINNVVDGWNHVVQWESEPAPSFTMGIRLLRLL